MSDKIKNPSEFNKEEIKKFHQLVKKGEEVEKYGLRKRIERAKLLAFHYENDTLVGVVALKQPYKTYTKSVFKKAGLSKESNNYNLEIGWAFTVPEYRGNSICSNLIEKFISRLQSQNIFATTKKDNSSMKKILERNGFQKTGKSYVGRTSEYHLQLFTLSNRGNYERNEVHP